MAGLIAPATLEQIRAASDVVDVIGAYLPLSGLIGLPFADAYQVVAWLCWVPNLVIAEWFVLRDRTLHDSIKVTA